MSLILLVDDDTDMMKLTANWLKRAGYEVETAVSGREVLDFLQHTKPSLILLDYAMPELSGPETYLEIQKDPSGKDIPVLFRTGMEEADAMDEISALGPVRVVSKADGKKQLLQAVGTLL